MVYSRGSLVQPMTRSSAGKASTTSRMPSRIRKPAGQTVYTGATGLDMYMVPGFATRV